ncbi:hypothetical protein [Devosia sp. 2618]|uniref:hypothetical protein n=1 Tax=Devosia sp. 2618 TaxID=3156454 RepID=UPI0033916DCC
MRHIAISLAALCLCSAVSLPMPTQANSLNTLDSALAVGQWEQAAEIAQELDERAQRGDIMAAYAASVRHAAQGQCEEAAVLADVVTRVLPLFAAPYSLAYRCLMALGNRPAALARLETLIAILPQGTERDIISQILQNERAKDRPAFSAYASASPSSNVNRQTDATTINGGPWGVGTIPNSARGQAGTIFDAGGTMTVQLATLENLTIAGVLRTDVRYSTADQVFQPSFGAELPLTFRSTASINAVFTPYVAVGLHDGQHTRSEAGGKTSISLPISAHSRLVLNLRIAAVERPLNPTRNSVVVDGGASASTVLAPNVNLTTSARVLYDHTADETLRSLEATAAARIDTLLEGGLLLGVEGTIGQRYHARPAPFVLGQNQVDTFVSARTEVSHRALKIGPFMPTVNYQYSKSWSDNVF